MIKVICNRIPTGDIRARQPKSPGQKAQEWNKPLGPNVAPAEPAIVWANRTKLDHRCTRCGHQGHPKA